MHYVAVLYHILFAFYAHFSGSLHSSLASERYKVVVLDNLGADEATLEVGVDYTGALQSL